MALNPVKIYGLPRSGTNIVESLIRRNLLRLQLLVNEIGWKHAESKFRDRCRVCEACGLRLENVRFLVCVRNPYEWLKAAQRYERLIDVGAPETFTDWLRHPMKMYQEKGRQLTPPEAFNTLLPHWLSLAELDRDLLVIRAEDTRTPDAQRAVCERIRQAFDLQCYPDFVPIGQRIYPGQILLDADYKPVEYALNEQELRAASRVLDPDVIRLTGYEPVLI